MNLFPEQQRWGDIKFIFAKDMQYDERAWCIVGFLAAGVFLQFFVNFWAGFCAFIIGTSLSLVRGYRVTARLKGVEEWAQVTPDEYEKVKEKDAQLRRWDLDFFDITNHRGVAVFVLVGLFCFVIWKTFIIKGFYRIAFYWVLDCIVLIIPHWVTGIRSYLKKDKLIIKIGILKKIIAYLVSPEDIQVLPMLATQEVVGKGRIPTDARLMLRFLNAPDYFLGVQVQVSINTVEGTDYPYLYCVILAKSGAGLAILKTDDMDIPLQRVTLENQVSEDVDVLVVRQTTSANSGYDTNELDCRRLLDTAVGLARRFISQ
ncbi:MAG TPA: hypothetical protein PKL77_00500 [Candidatus Omnitrophota bacterium]|nr:hypothetical protein [Candidatus Omnitrophota bacterium]HPT06598.1 hypothetical protein [Candidatus Omnitrophota bacterium]